MTPPPEVFSELTDILRKGILIIRNRASTYDSQAMVVEADHLQNLPDLLEDFTAELLEDYLNCVKTNYVNQTKLSYEMYLINWEKLDDWLLKNYEGQP